MRMFAVAEKRKFAYNLVIIKWLKRLEKKAMLSEFAYISKFNIQTARCSVLVHTFATGHGLQHARTTVQHQHLQFIKHMSIGLVMPSNHVILCHHLYLLSLSNFSQHQVLLNESVLHIRWAKFLSSGLQHQSFQ